ncbi:MAG: LysR family transcriptional regulator [Pseudomonadota bacterium]
MIDATCGAAPLTGQIERIRVFLEVAERGSFAAAARALGISRSVATRQISELEASLGAQLLVRTTRKVSLTAAGALYRDRTRTLVDDLARTDEFVRRQQQTLTGSLRVSAPLSRGMRLLPDAISRFRILYDRVDLGLDLSDRFVDIVSEEYDMALRISGPPSDKSTIWRKICAVPRVVVAAPDYLQQRGTPAVPADLAEHECLAYTYYAGGPVWSFDHATTGETGAVSVRSTFSCNNGDVIAGLAVRGEGVALLPLFIVARAIENGQLVPLLTDWKSPEIWLTAYYPPYDHLPAKVATFTSFIEDVVAADPTLLSEPPEAFVDNALDVSTPSG